MSEYTARTCDVIHDLGAAGTLSLIEESLVFEHILMRLINELPDEQVSALTQEIINELQLEGSTLHGAVTEDPEHFINCFHRLINFGHR